jgi:hypothetical protein
MARQITERRRRTLEAMRQQYKEAAAARREARFDDFLFLVQSGNSAEQAAQRLGTNARALQRQAYRYQRKDIIKYLGSATYRQRHGL